ncbi:MAG: hypothetical protein DA330_04795 [Nitrososphaera sp.]|nr:hypothetical protein [Nitrososphaera sp.]
MVLELSFLSVDVVILGVLAYVIGLVSVMAYQRYAPKRSDSRSEDAVAEAIVLEYTRRLKEYDRAISEIRARLDVMDMRLPAGAPSHTSQVGSYARVVSEPVTVTQHQPTASIEGQNGTTDYILKLLVEKNLTSRDVKQAIGRTREHTARLMKKLTEAGFVERQVNSKPFRYTITEAGRMRLKGKAEAVPASEIQQAAV